MPTSHFTAVSPIARSARRVPGAVALALLIVFALAGSANAADVFGPDISAGVVGSCGASVNDWCNIVTDSVPGGNASAISDGVVTSVAFKHVGDYTMGALHLLRPTGAPNTFTNVADVGISIPASTTPGGEITTYPVRLPIKAGDRVGLGYHQPPLGLVIGAGLITQTCLYYQGPTQAHAPGTVVAYSGPSACNFPVAMRVTVEPDADSDGYGDETQDFCPALPAQFAPCPFAVAPKVYIGRVAKVKFGSIVVQQSVDQAAQLVTSAKVKVGKRTFSSRAVTNHVAAGQIAQVKIKFKASAKTAISAALNGGAKLKIVFAGKATNSGGKTGSRTTTAKLVR